MSRSRRSRCRTLPKMNMLTSSRGPPGVRSGNHDRPNPASALRPEADVEVAASNDCYGPCVDPRTRLIASLGGASFRDASWLRSRGAFGVASYCRLSIWTLDQFE